MISSRCNCHYIGDSYFYASSEIDAFSDNLLSILILATKLADRLFILTYLCTHAINFYELHTI